MLTVYYGDMENAIYNTAVYFKNTYLDAWIEDDFAKQAIKAVDKAEVIGPCLIESRVLGPISPLELSGGVKTLILVKNNPDMVFNASTCGDNCARWLLKIGKAQDVTVNLRHMMDFGGRRFTLTVGNTGQVVHSMEELVPIAGELL